MRNVVGKKVNREEDDFISDLKDRNDLLQRENKALEGKLKNASLTLKKYKQQLFSLKTRYGIGSSSLSSTSSIKSNAKHSNSKGCRVGVDSYCDTYQRSDDDNIVEHSKVQYRLTKMEETIDSLMKEKKGLVARHTEMDDHLHKSCSQLKARTNEVREC